MILDALRFLTVLPVPGASGARPPRADAVAAFPLVGLLVGLAWAGTSQVAGLSMFPSTAVAAGLVLLVDGVVTGALHLDATADVADGAASRRPADEAVAIMRQPVVGAVGAAALVLLCLVRFGALITAVDFTMRLIAVPVAGRGAMALLMALIPARADGSLAQAFGRPPRVAVGLALVFTVTPAIALAGVRGGIGLAAAGVLTGAYAWWWRRRFGGLTGDGVGCCGLLAETAMLLAIAAR